MRMSQAGNIYSLSPNPQQQSLTYRLFWPICQQTFVTSQVGEKDEGIVYLSLHFARVTNVHRLSECPVF